MLAFSDIYLVVRGVHGVRSWCSFVKGVLEEVSRACEGIWSLVGGYIEVELVEAGVPRPVKYIVAVLCTCDNVCRCLLGVSFYKHLCCSFLL